MSDLLIYLHDHLAGSRFAIELLENLSKLENESDIAILASNLLPEIVADRQYLEQLIEERGGDSRSVKDIASWIAERASRLKLNHKTPLGLFEAVEFLCLGVLGKRSLWTALEGAGKDSIPALSRLKARADSQHELLEAARLELAARLFRDWDIDAKYFRFEESLKIWAQRHGIEVSRQQFSEHKAGEFNGVRIFMNSSYPARERLYYAVHAVGSIAIWSVRQDAVQSMFDELRDAKKSKSSESDRFVAAIEQYRDFEKQSSEHAVWILQQIGAFGEIPDYTNLMQADLEAMTQFHEIGKAPVWDEFFTRWNREVASGERSIDLFEDKAVEDFQAVEIETQEILQRQ